MMAADREVRGRISRNLSLIRERMEAACARAGRDVSEVTLVAVTKTVGIGECEALLDLGVTHLGENRVEHAESKIAAIGDRAVWHMVGSVQRRKAKRVAALFDRADSVDRLELAESLNEAAADREGPLPVLVQVNTSGEASKHGFSPEELPAALDAIRGLSNLRVDGLMTMAPFEAEAEETRPVFRALSELARAHGLSALSMGMTNDFEVAIEEGATEVRIGTALFT